jgi:hypothetical protein
MSGRVTWWFGPSPTESVRMLSDDALVEVLSFAERVAHTLENNASPTAPAVLMWRGRLHCLRVYGCLASIEAYNRRGLDLDMFWKFNGPLRGMLDEGSEFKMPVWQTDEDLWMSHMSSAERDGLLVEDHGIKFHNDDWHYIPMLWPIPDGRGGYDLHISKKDKEAVLVDDLFLPADMRSRVVNF